MAKKYIIMFSNNNPASSSWREVFERRKKLTVESDNFKSFIAFLVAQDKLPDEDLYQKNIKRSCLK